VSSNLLALAVGFSGLVLLVLTTVIHYEVLRGLSAALPRLPVAPRSKLIVVILVSFVAHCVEIALYAGAYHLLVNVLGDGLMGGPAPAPLSRLLYFSAETYTSLGYGDVVPHGPVRMLAGTEALNGLLLIGWSASFTYMAMERFWGRPGG
jgi:hypothetical protein